MPAISKGRPFYSLCNRERMWRHDLKRFGTTRWIATLLLGTIALADAASLGDSRSEVIQQHGEPVWRADDSDQRVAYRWGVWEMEVEYQNGHVSRLVFTKEGPFTEGDVLRFFGENGGASLWQATSPTRWKRLDGAVAEIDPRQPQTIRFSGGRFHPGAAAARSPHPKGAETPVTLPKATVFPTVPGLEPKKVAEGIAEFIFNILILVAVFLVVAWFRARMMLCNKQAQLPFNGVQQLPEGEPKEEVIEVKPVRRVVETDDVESVSGTALSTEVHLHGSFHLSREGWGQFELVVGELFRRLGYSVSISAGLGVGDEVVVRITKDWLTRLVFCRHGMDRLVSEGEVRRFVEAVAEEEAAGGIFVSLTKFSANAVACASGKPIELLTQADLAALIRQVQKPGENLWMISEWISDFLHSSEITDPKCPRCRGGMRLRQPDGVRPYWECLSVHRCGGRRDVRLEVIKLTGTPRYG